MYCEKMQLFKQNLRWTMDRKERSDWNQLDRQTSHISIIFYRTWRIKFIQQNHCYIQTSKDCFLMKSKYWEGGSMEGRYSETLAVHAGTRRYAQRRELCESNAILWLRNMSQRPDRTFFPRAVQSSVFISLRNLILLTQD